MNAPQSNWTRLATAFRRFGKEFSFRHEHQKMVGEALASGNLDTRVAYMLSGEPTYAKVPTAFWKARAPHWSTRQLRPHLVIDVQELTSTIGLPEASTDIDVEACEKHLLELERLLKKLVEPDEAPSLRVGSSVLPPETIEFGGRPFKHDWRELAAVAANWIADNGPGVPRVRLHRLLQEHAERGWKACPETRDLNRWIVDIQSTEIGLPVSPSPIADAKSAALQKKGYASAAAIAGAWLHTHGLEVPKSHLENYLVEWFVATQALRPSRQDVETFVSRVYSLAKAQ